MGLFNLIVVLAICGFALIGANTAYKYYCPQIFGFFDDYVLRYYDKFCSLEDLSGRYLPHECIMKNLMKN